jgi:tRNA modification GTPase
MISLFTETGASRAVGGPRAIAIAAGTLGVAEAQLDRRVRVRWARDPAGQRLDQVLAFAMRAPASFTREDVAELHGHGGRATSSSCWRPWSHGARIAEPGEFTRRTVARGKLDLLRAEP